VGPDTLGEVDGGSAACRSRADTGIKMAHRTAMTRRTHLRDSTTPPRCSIVVNQ
jgi:hypothetical protein